MSDPRKYIAAIGFSGSLALGLCIWSFIRVQNNIGSSYDLDMIKNEVPILLGINLPALLSLTLMTLFFYLADSRLCTFFLLAVSCMALSFSYSSFCMSVLSKLGTV